MSTQNLPFLNTKKEDHPKLFQICIHGIFSKGLKEFETAVVNEPSVFESLKFYCIYKLASHFHMSEDSYMYITAHTEVFDRKTCL